MITQRLFHGTKVRLTGRRPDDAAIMAAWMEDDFYPRLVDTDFARPVSADSLAARESDADASHVSFRIRTVADDRLVGFCALFNIEWNNRSATLAIGIGKAEDRGKGFGAEALQLLLRYAFMELNLHRLSLDVISYNEPAIRAYRRAGFKEEGRMREAVYREGKRYDRLIMGLLKSEWQPC